MTHKEIAARLRALADREPTYVWRELYALAREVEDRADEAGDLEALVRATQPSTTPARVTPLAVARRFLGGRR